MLRSPTLPSKLDEITPLLIETNNMIFSPLLRFLTTEREILQKDNHLVNYSGATLPKLYTIHRQVLDEITKRQPQVQKEAQEKQELWISDLTNLEFFELHSIKKEDNYSEIRNRVKTMQETIISTSEPRIAKVIKLCESEILIWKAIAKNLRYISRVAKSQGGIANNADDGVVIKGIVDVGHKKFEVSTQNPLYYLDYANFLNNLEERRKWLQNSASDTRKQIFIETSYFTVDPIQALKTTLKRNLMYISYVTLASGLTSAIETIYKMVNAKEPEGNDLRIISIIKFVLAAIGAICNLVSKFFIKIDQTMSDRMKEQEENINNVFAEIQEI